MQFMAIVKATKDSEAGAPPNPGLLAAVGKASEEGLKAGSIVSTGGLAPSSKGFRVTAVNGKLKVTDGPFSETKELIAGFAILDEASSKEEAIRMSKDFMQLHIDHLGNSYEGECEVRPMMGPEDFCMERK